MNADFMTQNKDHGRAAKNSRYMQQTMELCAASVLVSFSDFWNLRIPSLRAIG